MRKNPRFFAFSLLLIAVAATAPGSATKGSKRVLRPLVTDWTSRHVVFSAPRTFEQAFRLQRDPRYQQQWMRRNVHTALPSSAQATVAPSTDPFSFAPGGLHGWGGRGGGGRSRGRRGPRFHGDWSVNIGSSAKMEDNMFPAKFSFDFNTASCSDFAVFTTGLAGSGDNVADIVSFDNLYTGTGPDGLCGTGAPTVLFAYHTQSNAGISNSSPVLSGGVSGNGSQIAFMEGGAGIAALHILRGVAGEGTPGSGSAVLPTVVTSDAPTYVACLATASSCLLNLNFANSADDTFSAPFVNYDTDSLYVGDNTGLLHKFTGVFEGTPAEVTTGGWPITVDSGAILNSPIYELHSNNLYITDRNGILSFVREADSSVGACSIGSPPCLGAVTIDATSGNGPIDDAPIVDTTNETVFAFVGTDSTGNTASVIQVTTAMDNEVSATVGPSFAVVPVFSGDFDNNYFTNADPSTGFLYVCGNQVGSFPSLPQSAAIYRIGFNSSGTMNSANDGNVLGLTSPVDTGMGFGGTPTTCSPGTENDDGTTDLIFFSVHTGGLATNCADHGCVMSFDITSGFPSAAANSAQESSGTSGIIIDNISGAGQASSFYFTTRSDQICATLGIGGCAVKLTQANLN
jgi:hypothetical protein